jgi:hypothetical protein
MGAAMAGAAGWRWRFITFFGELKKSQFFSFAKMIFFRIISALLLTCV